MTLTFQDGILHIQNIQNRSVHETLKITNTLFWQTPPLFRYFPKINTSDEISTPISQSLMTKKISHIIRDCDIGVKTHNIDVFRLNM